MLDPTKSSTMAGGWSLTARGLALAVAMGLGLALGAGTGSAQAQGRFGGRTAPGQDFDRTQLQPDIMFNGPDQRPVHGIRCATRPVNRLELDLMDAELRAWRLDQKSFATRQVGVPVAFHVITDGGQGDVSDGQIDEQIAVLDDAYAPYGFSFSLSSIDRTDNSSWYSGCAGGQESAMKGALAIDTATTLNIYTCEPDGGILGYAYLPGDLSAGDTDDGVVLLHSSLPGGDAAPYNEGDTGTHEVGHYLGLLHTFDGGCDSDGDLVADTPDEADAAYGCPIGRDSCSGEGLDPIENFMDYTDDACMNQFTPLQGARMSDLTAMHRPDLGAGGGGNGAGGGGNGGGDGGGGSTDLPPAPALVSPSGSIDQASPTYTWLPVSAPGLNRYQLQVARDGSGVVYDDGQDPASCSADSCSVTPELPLDDGDYTWHVRAQNGAGWGNWSADFFFTVAAAGGGGDGNGGGGGGDGDGGDGSGSGEPTVPPAPTLVSPAGPISERRPTFTWAPLSTDNGWIFYELRAIDAGGRVAYEDFSDSFECDATSCSLRAYAQFADGAYVWQLRGENDSGWSDWSAAMAFSIGNGGQVGSGPPAAPELLSPRGTIWDRRPSFEWNASDGATQYQIQINKRWWGIVHNQVYSDATSCAGSRCSFVPGNNLPKGRYTWRARARNGSGWSAWSTQTRFRVR